jgi:hypothetical protein
VLTVYGDDLVKRFAIPAPGKGSSVEPYLFDGVQEYFRIGGAWYNSLGKPIFTERNSPTADFFFEERGTVKVAHAADGKLLIYSFQ